MFLLDLSYSFSKHKIISRGKWPAKGEAKALLYYLLCASLQVAATG
jgi:hypothetical protein